MYNVPFLVIQEIDYCTAFGPCRIRRVVLAIAVLILLEVVSAIVRRQSHSSFAREFLHQVHGITRFGLLAISCNARAAPTTSCSQPPESVYHNS